MPVAVICSRSGTRRVVSWLAPCEISRTPVARTPLPRRCSLVALGRPLLPWRYLQSLARRRHPLRWLQKRAQSPLARLHALGGTYVGGIGTRPCSRHSRPQTPRMPAPSPPATVWRYPPPLYALASMLVIRTRKQEVGFSFFLLPFRVKKKRKTPASHVRWPIFFRSKKRYFIGPISAPILKPFGLFIIRSIGNWHRLWCLFPRGALSAAAGFLQQSLAHRQRA